ncbi:MAG: regulatory protein RecX [Chloroflexota bacterium]
MSASVALAHGVRTGMEVTVDDLRSFEIDDEVERGHAAALNFLSYRPRSTREVRDYLRKRGVSDSQSDEIFARLERTGLMDDGQFARFWVENRQAFRPRGRFALKMELRRKGVADNVIEEALTDLGDEDVTAHDVGMKKARSFPLHDERAFVQRLVGFLQRRGFPYDVASSTARSIYREMTEET